MLLGVKNLTRPLYLPVIVVVFVITVAMASVATRRTQRTKRGLLELAGVIKCSTGRSALAYMMYGCYCGLGGQGWPRDRADWWGTGFNHTFERAQNTTLCLKNTTTGHCFVDTHYRVHWCIICCKGLSPACVHSVHSVYSVFPPCRGINSSTVIRPPHFLTKLKCWARWVEREGVVQIK